jgi:hypothetical protein
LILTLDTTAAAAAAVFAAAAAAATAAAVLLNAMHECMINRSYYNKEHY